MSEHEALLEQGKLAEGVVAYVRSHDYVSFAELHRILAPHMGVEGNFALTIPDRPNQILWPGMSEALTDLLNELIQQSRIHVHPADWMIYMVDGRVPRMEMGKRPPKDRDYKKPHWLPVCFRTVPLAAT